MLVDYASDSEGSGDDQNIIPASKPATQEAKPKPAQAASLVPSQPKPRRREGPLKITLEAPKRSAEDEAAPESRPVKKAKLEGAGASSLLAMLPPPKNKDASISRKKKDDATSKPLAMLPGRDPLVTDEGNDIQENNLDPSKASLSLIPPSRLAKGREASKPKEDTSTDFFSLGTATSTNKPLIPSQEASLLPAIKSAAPSVKEFKPPTPTPQDEYPGYYKKPNGEWAMHDPEYYWSVASAWQKPSVEEEMQKHAAPSEKRSKRPWDGDEEDLQQISAMDEASRTRAEIENSKSLTVNAIRTGPTAPNMKMTEARMSHRAKSRHQLSTLLTDAYAHRAELEDKIATARRNRKESGMKYGF